MGELSSLTKLRPASIFDVETISNISILSDPDYGTPDSPLAKYVYFSRAFVPTYYIFAALVILAASAVHHCTVRSQRNLSRLSRNEERKSPISSSSASSTLAEEEESTPKDGNDEERIPLLSRNVAHLSKRGFVARLTSHVVALAAYQPKPIPAVTARANQLPTNGTSLLILFFLFVNAFYLIYKIPSYSPLAFAFTFAGRAGACFTVNLPILYILAAKNNQPLKWLTGWTYERINIYHRRLGEWMMFLAVVHLIGMFFTWYDLLRPLGYGWQWFWSEPFIILGLVAWLSYLTIWITSIGYVREKAYEFFLASHIVLQTIALVTLTLHHSSTNIPYCAITLAIWVIDRGVLRIFVSNKKFIATLEVAADKETVLLFCDIPLNRSKQGDIRSGWKAGQHVFLTVPGIKWHHAFQAHPFTIASPAPPAGADETLWQMQLIIRPMDGFSRELLEYAKLHQHTEIILDGPYGNTDIVDDVLSADRVCLIAGGSGITLTYPLAWSLYAGDHDVPTVTNRVIYDNGRKRTPRIVLRSSASEDVRAHLWIRQYPEQSSWVTRFPVDYTTRHTPLETDHGSHGVDLISRTFETRRGSEGRPDVATEIRTWIERGSNSLAGCDQRVCMVVCGPDGLVRDVRNCAAALIREGHNIELHVEKFGW